MVLEVQREPFSPLRTYFLTNDSCELECSLYRSVKVREGSYRKQPLVLEWSALFE